MSNEKKGTPMSDEYLRTREEAYPELDFGDRDTFELPADLSVLGRGAEVKEERNPLQTHPGLQLLQTNTIGGPHTGLDVRLCVSAELLEQMLEQARKSTTKRCVIHSAGILVKTWRGETDGHVFQTLEIGGRKAVPEDPLIIKGLMGPQGG